jgi:Tol biopolymer transport system component
MTGLLVVAGDSIREAQLWIIDRSNGDARRVTNDLSTYRAVGLTNDGKTFSTVQAEGLVNLWVAPGGSAAKAIRLPTGNVGFYSSAGKNIAWTADGRIIYVSNESGTPQLWLTNPDGSNRKQLTSAGNSTSPFASPDGRFFVFGSYKDGGGSIWRLNVDGSNPIRLTPGPQDGYPSVTSDSKWVVFTSFSGAKPTIWKISIDGGTPVQITDHIALAGIVSPDMKWISFFYPDSPDPQAPPNKLAVMPFEGNGEIKTFSFTPGGTVPPRNQWSNDSKSVFYSTTSNNTSNIWSQPISGGPPKQVTEFNDSLITSFAWSPDGKQLAATRGHLLRDAVLITDVKKD